MTEKKKRTPSLQALDNIREILIEQCQTAHSHRKDYSHEYDESEEHLALIAGKDAIITRISKEIEEYAVKKYEKYGVAIVLVCHRKEDSGNDRLRIDLKMKIFPGTEDLFAADKKADDIYRADLQKTDDWYYAALQAVTKREELPDVPVFWKTPEFREGK